jgi:hypothetical protein
VQVATARWGLHLTILTSAAGIDPAPKPAYRLGSAGDDPQDTGTGRPAGEATPVEHEDLPFKVELWDDARVSVEQVLAVTASGSIGYAAYYAATREYPDRYITLRHRNSILSKWNAVH